MNVGNLVLKQIRNDQMADLREAGWTYRMIGEDYGLSKSRTSLLIQRQQAGYRYDPDRRCRGCRWPGESHHSSCPDRSFCSCDPAEQIRFPWHKVCGNCDFWIP